MTSYLCCVSISNKLGFELQQLLTYPDNCLMEVVKFRSLGCGGSESMQTRRRIPSVARQLNRSGTVSAD